MANEDRLWRLAAAEAAEGRTTVLCTVIASTGSTPRETGARMLIGETGMLAGTVGGGCGEADVAVLARKVLSGAAIGSVVEVDLSGDFDQKAIQACGGTMQVLVELVTTERNDHLGRLAAAEETRVPVQLVQQVSGKMEWSLSPIAAGIAAPESALISDKAGQSWFVQTVGTREEVVIVGSGHVAQPLARMAAFLGYRVVIVDDRPGYATRDRFPEASDVRVGSHAQSLAALRPGSQSHVVIITRGHDHDEESLRETLRHRPAYVGMIGSRRRAIGTLKRLEGEGVPREVLDRVHTPIGLDIGAVTPEEIALAVMAEIVCERRGGAGTPLMHLRTRPRARTGDHDRCATP